MMVPVNQLHTNLELNKLFNFRVTLKVNRAVLANVSFGCVLLNDLLCKC